MGGNNFFFITSSGEAGACAGLPFSLEARAPVKPALNEVKLIKKNGDDDDDDHDKNDPPYFGALNFENTCFECFFKEILLFFRNMLDFLTKYTK